MGRKVVGHKGPGWLASVFMGRGPSWRGTYKRSALGRSGTALTRKPRKTGPSWGTGTGGRSHRRRGF